MRTSLLAAVLFGSACAASPTASPVSPETGPPPPGAAAKPSPDGAPMMHPGEIYRVLEKSEILYEIIAEGAVEHVPLETIVELVEDPKTVNSYLELKSEEGSTEKHLVISEPPPEIAELHHRAFLAFQAQEFYEARDYYMLAIERRPDYFKSYTYLGNTFFILGDLQRAETHLRRALEMNPLDYQAHLFIGDTYHHLGRLDAAKHHLTWALLLNRNNPVVQKRLDVTLSALHLRRKATWIEPNFSIEKRGDKKVTLRFDEESGLRWFPLANCMACWTYEDQCRVRDEAPDLPVRISMYRECLLNQAMTIALRLDRKEPVPMDERTLYAAITGGYLEALVFWEVAARRVPIIMFLIDDDDRAKILEYIEKFVFDSGITT